MIDSKLLSEVDFVSSYKQEFQILRQLTKRSGRGRIVGVRRGVASLIEVLNECSRKLHR